MKKNSTVLLDDRSMLPENWAQAPLGNITKLGAGNPAPQGNQFFDNGTYPFVRVQDMGRLGISKYIMDTADRINHSAIERMKLFPKGTVLFTKSGASSLLNQRAVLKTDMYVVSHIAIAMPYDGILSDWIYYWLKTVDFNHIAHATTLPSIPLSKVNVIPILIAPTAEQERIISVIEEFFSDLDNAIENFKKAKEQLKVYRYSVLNQIAIGKDFVKFGNFIEQPKYGTARKCRKDSIGKAVLRIPNIGSQYIDLSDLKYAYFTNDEVNKYSLIEGDLLMIRSNGSVSLVGKTAIVTKKDTHALYAGYLIRLRLKSNLNSYYLQYILSSPQLRNQIEGKAKSTSGVHNINSEEIKDLLIPFCSLEDQLKIVEDVESRFSFCDSLELTINESIQKAEVLRQSVLKKAFEGNLTEQWRKEHKNLTSGDNSAKALLQRIKAEKEALEVKSKGKKKHD